MSNTKTAEEIKILIKGRIMDEYRKHPHLDWAELAASKLYSQWNEFFTSQHSTEIEELKQEVETQRKVFNEQVNKLLSEGGVRKKQITELKAELYSVKAKAEKLAKQVKDSNDYLDVVEQDCGTNPYLRELWSNNDEALTSFRETKGTDNDGWILASERLPETGQEVLANSSATKKPVQCTYKGADGFRIEKNHCHLDRTIITFLVDVITWMPLPKAPSTEVKKKI